MPGVLKAWPPWPQFTEAKGEWRTANAQYKQEIADKYGIDNIRQSLLKTCEALGALATEIAEKGISIIPVLTLGEFLDSSEQQKEKLKGEYDALWSEMLCLEQRQQNGSMD
jgi:hypothetical protein